MITLKQIILRRGPKVLLEDINLTLYARQKIGLIGKNGCGKSSFFALLLGELEAHQGEIAYPANLEIAHVRQETPGTTQAAIDYVIDGDRRFRVTENQLKEAEQNEDAELMAQCHDDLANMDGYAIEGKAEKILRGLGFSSKDLKKGTQEFSGGWRMRLNLAQALMSRSDLLLLDEPTNHLDLDAIMWLEKWLQEYTGTLLVISHDREFLDNSVDHILHFDNQQLQLYRGNFSSFEKQRAERLTLQQAGYEKQQVQIAHLTSFINRFKAKASKARQAQSRIKALEKMSLISAVEVRSSFSFQFKTPNSCPNPLIRMENASIGYAADTPVLSHVDLVIGPLDRIGLLGINGAGKSTLIKAIAGKLEPLSGRVEKYKGVSIGYFAQHQIDYLDLGHSPLEMMQQIAPYSADQVLRTFLGSFQFCGEMATQKVSHFSGGEKARLALALIVWQAPNVLLLDEPTNHLDMEMREALALALQDYQGALILVSHDRHLIRTTTDELILVSDGKVARFTGDLDDYKDWYFQKNPSFATKRSAKGNPGKEKRKLETRLKSIEDEMAKLHQANDRVEKLLADESLYTAKPSDILTKHLQEQQEIQQKLQAQEQSWLEIMHLLEAFNYD